MKTTLLLTIIVAGVWMMSLCQKPAIISSSSQLPLKTYYSYLDSTCEWHIDEMGHDSVHGCTHFSFIKHYIAGDTIMDEKWYYKLYSFTEGKNECHDGSITKSNDTKFEGGLREDSLKRIYFHPNGQPERLLWNFNINMGDTINTNWVISKIDTVWLGAKPLQRFYINCRGSMIIEGIGGNTGFLGAYFCSYSIKSSSSLIYYKKQNHLIQITGRMDFHKLLVH